MKIAICFSGLIRTGCLCSNNLFNYFGDYIKYIDFFIHTWNYENQAIPFPDCSYKDTILYDNIKSYKPHELQKSELDKFLSIYKPKQYQIESYDIFLDYYKKAISDTPNRTIFPLWVSFNRSVEIMNAYQKTNNLQYDYVVKIRPDIIINPNCSLQKDISLLEKLSDNTFLICNLGDKSQLREDSIFTDDVLFISRNQCMNDVSKFGLHTNNTHDYFMRFLLKNNIIPYNADTSSYAILRPHLVHLDTNKDFELIRKEDFLFYASREHYINIYGDN